MADGVVGGVEVGVSQSLVLSNVDAASHTRIEHVGKAGEVEAEASLAAGEVVGGADDGALEGEIG